MAKKLKLRYVFEPSTNTVTIKGNINRNRLLLITNVTDNIVIYNFADSALKASTVTYLPDTEETRIVLNYDCSDMGSGDQLQIFIEEDAVSFKPSDAFIDPVSKFRVSEAQTLIDTDFEYGLQSTKWETLELVNNVPGFYSKTGDTPLTVTNVAVTVGNTTITIIAPSHGQTVGTPLDIRGLNQTNLDGSYIITRVPDADTIIIAGKVAANATGSLNGPYTSVIPGRFYAGSQLNYSSIVGTGASITVNMQYPSGFKQGSEFYLVNSVGTEIINFDASLVDPADTDPNSATFNPNGVYNPGGTNVRSVDPWDYTGYLNSKFVPCSEPYIDVANDIINIDAHGFSNGDILALVVGPNSLVPTGLTDKGRYFVVQSGINTFRLATTSGGAAVNITGIGTGVIALLRGFTYTAINSSTDRVTIITNGATNAAPNTLLGGSNGSTAVSTNTELLLINTAATGGTSTPGFTTSPLAPLWTGASLNSYRFATVNTSIPQINSSNGTLINFTANTVVSSPVLVPVRTNPSANTINIAAHGLKALDDYNNDVGLAYTYRAGSSTVIGGLTNNATYYLEVIDDNTIGLSTTSGGARVNLTDYAATGVGHTFETTQTRPTKDTIFIPAHGLTAGQQVAYNNPTGNSDVGGLADDQTYYIISALDDVDDRIRLSETLNGTPVDITSAGVGTHQLLLSVAGDLDGSYSLDELINANAQSFTLNVSAASSITPTVKVFDPSVGLGTVGAGASANTITISNHTFITGTPVTYSSNGGTDIGGLTDSNEYYVIRISKDRVKLALDVDNATAGIGTTLSGPTTGIGNTHSLTSLSLAGELIGVGSVSIVEGSTRVIGTDTKFLSEFKLGDQFAIHIDENNTFESRIGAIGSDERLELVSAATTTLNGHEYLRKTSLYIKSEAYSVHRPYDGGVEINARKVADNQIIRQTRRYFRYQSGKGIAAQFAINFNPPLDVESITAIGTSATLKTRFRHEVGAGTSITVRNAEVSSGTNYYNGSFIVDSVVDPNIIIYTLNGTPSDLSANGFPELIVRDWDGSTMRAGMYDDQNGLFWEYDGTTLYAVRRNSVQQISGSLSVTNNSNLVTGTGSRFAEQLSVGDRIVIRGQSYKIVNIDSSSTMHIQPSYKGTTNSGVIASKTIDDKVAQQNFSFDPCDGTGPNGYLLDLTRIQMVYIDYSWYGAGKARFGFKDANGEVFYCHEFVHNNKKNEAYFRSGNLPARYEIENNGVPVFAPSLAHWGSTVQMDGRFEDDDAYLFTGSSSLLSFSGQSVVIGGATTTGTTYTYVNSNGSVVSGVTTTNIRTFSNASIGTANDTITFASAHGYATGQLVQYDKGTSGTAAAGLVNGRYYFARAITTTVITLFNSAEDAVANTNRVDITSQGTSGTMAIYSNFRFNVTPTTITGYGPRIIHRMRSTDSTFSTLQNITFGTPITSTAIAARGGNNSPAAYVYRVSQVLAGSTAAFVDFFFANEPVSTSNPSFPSTGETGFIPTGTASNIDHTFGEDNPPPSLIPLISIRLAPSVDSGLTGDVGVREIINRMQLDLRGVGLLTTHDVDIRLILNGQLDNNNWATQGRPSLSQLISHQNEDTLTSGIIIFSFRASGGTEVSAGGLRNSNTFSQDISDLLSLGNAILGGDGTFPDGPDVLTLAISPLNPSQITLTSPLSVSGRITWSESQA
jgi:hypothetical protein